MEDHNADIRRLRVLRDDLRTMQVNRSHAIDERDPRYLHFSDAIIAVGWLIDDLARDGGPQITETDRGCSCDVEAGADEGRFLVRQVASDGISIGDLAGLLKCGQGNTRADKGQREAGKELPWT